MDRIKSEGPVRYKFVFVVFDDYERTECLYVTSEVNSRAALSGGGSHFLCLFHNGEHSNFGASDDYGQIDKFEDAAMSLALKMLGEQAEEPRPATSDLSYGTFRHFTDDLHNCLSSLLIVEQELLKFRPGPVNFSTYRLHLSDVHDRCLRTRNSILPHANQAAGNYAINVAVTFADSLLESIMWLREICTHLEEKATGGRYGFMQYRRDMKEYKSREAARELAGSQLNSAVQRPW
jgi:hypothetical protein